MTDFRDSLCYGCAYENKVLSRGMQDERGTCSDCGAEDVQLIIPDHGDPRARSVFTAE